MAIDAAESPSSPSHSPSNFSQLRHFYVAVDRLQFKLETLVDLLGVAGRRPCLPMVICCSSRDELDAGCAAVSNLPYISFASIYSDLVEAERAQTFEKFRQAAVTWNQKVAAQSGDEILTEKDDQKSNMIVITDACLPLITSAEAPILARVLINYELPMKMETYARQMATCLVADGIVINMVVGGEVVTLKSIEESSNLVIAEMPINTVSYLRFCEDIVLPEDLEPARREDLICRRKRPVPNPFFLSHMQMLETSKTDELQQLPCPIK